MKKLGFIENDWNLPVFMVPDPPPEPDGPDDDEPPTPPKPRFSCS